MTYNYEMRNAIVLVLTTVPSEALGEEIGRALVVERLAACVNVSAPMTSIYRWNESIEQEAERQLVIKTTADRIASVEQRIRELHSYELPECLVIETAGGSDAYLNWVTAGSHS
jgi:periplasmic divalent cation tolerance protein